LRSVPVYFEEIKQRLTGDLSLFYPTVILAL